MAVAGTAPRAQGADFTAQAARAVQDRVRVMAPAPASTDRLALIAKLQAANLAETRSVLWLADGLDAGSGKSFADLN